MIKKLVALTIILNCLLSHTSNCVYALSYKNQVIKTGIQKNVEKEINKKKNYEIPIIEDEIAQVQTVGTKGKKKKYKQDVINDDALDGLKIAKLPQKRKYKRVLISDEEVILTEENKKFKRPVYTGQIKTENGLVVMLKPLKKVKTKSSYLKVKNENKTEKYKISSPSIGDQIAFKVIEDVQKDGKIIIPKNTIVYAKVGTISPRAMGGAPAEMTLENFEMMDKNGKLVPLSGEISSSGYSLSFWIGLAELATTPFLFGLAVPLLRLLPGGQAVVSPRKNYVVYY